MLLGLTVLCDLINSEDNFALFIAIWSVHLSLLTFHNSPAHEEHQRENQVYIPALGIDKNCDSVKQQCRAYTCIQCYHFFAILKDFRTPESHI